LNIFVGQFAFADDFASISNQLSKAGNIHSCTKGYDLLSGQIGTQQPLIKGALPFVLNYQAAVRADAMSALVYSLNQNE
jgi:hypothetical protein